MREWSDDELEDEEYPDDFDDEEDDESDTVPCPECGRAIYEDSEQCPACGAYITASTSPFQNRPVWWLILAGLGIVALLGALLFRG